MANLTRQQVAEYIAAKRRRDRGDPYMETRIALTDQDRLGLYGLLPGQRDDPGLGTQGTGRRSGQVRRVPSLRGNRSGEYEHRNLGPYTVGTTPTGEGLSYRMIQKPYRGNIDLSRHDRFRFEPSNVGENIAYPRRMPTTLAQASPVPRWDQIRVLGSTIGRQLEEDLAHEVGHRAHRISGLVGDEESSDRWHNVLYGQQPQTTRTVYRGTDIPAGLRTTTRPKYSVTHSGERVPIDKEQAKKDSLIADALARKIMKQQERERIRRYMQGAVDL